MFVANELSGRLFTILYLDDRRVDDIGPWMEVRDCSRVKLYSPYLKLGFKIPTLSSCKMFAGREVVGDRLDWAGVSYVVKPENKLSYDVVFENGIV